MSNTVLSLDTLDFYANQLKHWSTALKPTALFLYGCSVATGNAGFEFTVQLQQLTGATIAASAHPLGNAALDGN